MERLRSWCWLVVSQLCCRNQSHPGIGGLQRDYVQLDHLHHGVGGTLGLDSIGIGHHLTKNRWNDLPREAETILQPTALLRRATSEKGIPVSVDLGLIFKVHDE